MLLRFFVLIVLSFPLFAEAKKLTIIHTNDLHSHILGFSPSIDYTPYTTEDDQTLGGYARIATLVKNIKSSQKNPTLWLDAGDFSMGTLFHLSIRQTGFELNLMKEMGMDATTIGNHEFDLKPSGLANIIESALKSGNIPNIVSSNFVFNKESSEDDALEELFKKEVIEPYKVIEADGLKIGIFGMLGKDAAEVAPFSKPIQFRDSVTVAKEMVKTLREKENVDVVIFLSHGGVFQNKDISEDEITAREVNGIDLIVSGHTSQKLLQPLNINNTLIVHTGDYGKNVGVANLLVENKQVKLEKYELVEINDSIPGDPVIQKKVESYIDYIDKNVLSEFNLRFFQVVAETDFDLKKDIIESNIGNIVADSMRWYVDQFEADPDDPTTKVDVALEGRGVIRDNILKGKTGKIVVADIFVVMPLGLGMDNSMGYPLLSSYIYAWELKDALEIMASIAPIKEDKFNLRVSGLKFSYNPNRMIFDRVTEIYLGDEETGYKRLDYSKKNKRLYKVVANLYNSMLLSFVEKFTKGVLAITPKDKNGKPIKDLTLAIVDSNPQKQGIQELKQWPALIKYMQSFSDTDGNGISNIPEKYRTTLGRVQRISSWNPINLLSRANNITLFALVVVISLLGVIVGLGFFVYKKFRK
ncbi:MAG: 5'-nucleotidase C-terminal domain-containing protein [Leptospiraceae bacterium]|nr:5'-nucleotidase C-terminal domain-containing protein [Leptospiraceae bacterium]